MTDQDEVQLDNITSTLQRLADESVAYVTIHRGSVLRLLEIIRCMRDELEECENFYSE